MGTATGNEPLVGDASRTGLDLSRNRENVFMVKVYKTLQWEKDACPPDCFACEETCVHRNDNGPLDSAIKVVHKPGDSYHNVITCLQCSEPACQEACTTGAIQKSKEDGIVRILQEKCIGCGMCALACPYGGIYISSEKNLAYKCDACDGKPKCVEACPLHILSFFEGDRISPYMGDEDFLSPGTRACSGCPAELSLRHTLRIVGRGAVFFGAPGCMTTLMIGSGDKAGGKLPYFNCLFTNVPSTMTGVHRYYKSKGKEVKLVAFVGDGCAVDIGFQALSGAAERGENFIFICYDNEGYMNTGNQRSSTTPPHAWTNTTPVGGEFRGKEKNSKYLPLIMAFHGIPYVATATIAYLEDYAQKLEKALAVKDGLSYIHLFTPCPPGWRSSIESGIEISRLAVETNYFPLWECERGQFRFTRDVSNPKPIGKYTRLIGKFSHLQETEIQELQEMVNQRVNMIKSLVNIREVRG